jgi:hypothetical protein
VNFLLAIFLGWGFDFCGLFVAWVVFCKMVIFMKGVALEWKLFIVKFLDMDPII